MWLKKPHEEPLSSHLPWQAWGNYYCVDVSSGRRSSLGVCSRKEAEEVVMAKNQADCQPALNLQMARPSNTKKSGLSPVQNTSRSSSGNNPERKAFYELAWHLGAAQSDTAFLDARNVDWQNQTISFSRKKTGSIASPHRQCLS